MKNGLHRIYLAEVASGILSGSCAMQEICATSRESFPQHRALASLSIGDYTLMCTASGYADDPPETVETSASGGA